MWLLQRAMLVEEWQDGLLLFGGVPRDWLRPGSGVAFAGLPTRYGPVSAELVLDEHGQTAVTVSGVDARVPVWTVLPGRDASISTRPGD